MSTPAIPPGGLRLAEAPMDPDAPDDPNVAALRRFFTALDTADGPALEALLDPAVVQTVSGRSPLSGQHEGRAAVGALAARIRGLLDRPPVMTPMVWLAAGPHAHVVAHVEMARGATTLATDQTMVFAFEAGRITTIRDYQDDQYLVDEFWSAVVHAAAAPLRDTGLEDLAPRRGPRPQTSEALPHQQLTQIAPVSLQDVLHAHILGLEGVLPGDSVIWGEGARAYWLAEELRGGPSGSSIRGGEWGHMHGPDDGSLHLALPRATALAVEELGWGELHPLSRSGDEPYAITMVYGPRDERELPAVEALAEAAYRGARGLS